MTWKKETTGDQNAAKTELWQVVIQSFENFQNAKPPEEIFLLNAVEQITTGIEQV